MCACDDRRGGTPSQLVMLPTAGEPVSFPISTSQYMAQHACLLHPVGPHKANNEILMTIRNTIIDNDMMSSLDVPSLVSDFLSLSKVLWESLCGGRPYLYQFPSIIVA